MKKTAFILVLLTMLFSCKKHRLKGDRETLVGKWEWAYSIEITGLGTGNLVFDTILPADVSGSYSIKFLKKGNIFFEKNSVEEFKYRTVFREFQIAGSVPGCFVNNGDVYDFNIFLNGNDDNRMNGCVSSDSLMFFNRDFPFIDEYDEINEAYTTLHRNVFTRVN